MKIQLLKYSLLLLLFMFFGCNQTAKHEKQEKLIATNQIRHAKGFELHNYNGYSVLKVNTPWPNSKDSFTYILKEKNGVIPDSLLQYTSISVPIQTIVVTSTTHIPPLELLEVEKTLVGFPTTDYISSKKTRALIKEGKIREVGKNENLNTEVLLDLSPDLLVGFGISNVNPTLDNIQKSGLPLFYNGDWTEQTPLGRAEWIKFFGAIYGLQPKANLIFNQIEKEYGTALKLAKKVKNKPTVLCGSLYQNQWYVPQGDSWASLFLKEAQSNYLWKDTKGIGSLSLSFEKVFEKGKTAELWIAPGDFQSLREMADSNPHYNQFDSFRNKKVYSYATNRGETGGIIYFEWAASRPDWVLKDLIKIIHPELLPNYTPYFFQQLH
jgi:iron complex transport system substrate-binding protein